MKTLSKQDVAGESVGGIGAVAVSRWSDPRRAVGPRLRAKRGSSRWSVPAASELRDGSQGTLGPASASLRRQPPRRWLSEPGSVVHFNGSGPDSLASPPPFRVLVGEVAATLGFAAGHQSRRAFGWE